MLTHIKNKKRTVIVVASCAVLIALAGGAVALYAVNSNNKVAEDGETMGQSTASPDAPQTATTPTSSTSNSSGPSSNSDSTAGPSIDASITPIAPSGTFVSSHQTSAVSAYAITSTCSTTPGASCVVTFTQGSAVKSLPSQITNTDGNTSWTWKPQDIGLTAGEWNIVATATNGERSSSTTDSLNMVVSN